jgi:MYXO-CTERM domain-containing protein
MDYGSLNLGSNTNISDLFAIDVSGLKDQNGVSPQFFQFSVVDDSANHQLLLNYTSAIPEPSTYGVSLGALGLAIAAVRRRRRVPVA